MYIFHQENFKKIYLIFLSFIILSSIMLLNPKPVSALAPMILTDKQDSYQLGLSMEYLEDKDKKWTIEDVSSDEM
ncbi:MAG: hypothetical protein HQK91_11235, partial [Nitrospirae bacterium]|nr:hypothetical protein [Nitrospirota bacterium]